ncbi:hypothetical protein NUU61_007576 [Penicillium alfredii]|uniref:C2H2-type domain-containing protein n=1 Tax=Penicillium alfredii TaxID=1506179 RepID=A0A9W9EQY1_9EURO|nr:uncharacterized protein NUU61_007576 [Penicillium alfredii]KAJ5086269.1 hypothetical protein NUU61_007576 [Penicillium alfredii]
MPDLPIFLSNCPAYDEYDDEGLVTVYHGEFWCRWPQCHRGKKGFNATNNLRKHVASVHNLAVKLADVGNLTGTEQDAIRTWYDDLIDDQEE